MPPQKTASCLHYGDMTRHGGITNIYKKHQQKKWKYYQAV